MKISKIKNLVSGLKNKPKQPNILRIGPNDNYDDKRFKRLKCKTFHGDIFIENAESENIPCFEFETLNGNLYVENSNTVWGLNEIKNITGDLVIKNSDITWFNSLVEVGGNLVIENSEISWLNELNSVAKNIQIKNSFIAWCGIAEVDDACVIKKTDHPPVRPAKFIESYNRAPQQQPTNESPVK